MIILYILGGIAAIIALFVVLAPALEKQARTKAPEKLKDAQQEFKNGNQDKCIDLLQDAFFVPSNETYDRQIAEHNLRVLELLKEVLDDMNIEHPGYIDRLATEFGKAGASEIKIGEEFTNPVEKLLEKLFMNEGKNISNLMDMVKSGAIEVRESDENDFTGLVAEEHNAVINKVGQYLLGGKAEAAIELLNARIPADSNEATATFLEQRAGAYAMAGQHDKALADYDAILELYPNHQRTFENIDDVKSEMKK